MALSLSIAFCTRNRPDELLIAVSSVCRQASDITHCSVELLIIDDGSLSASLLAALREMADGATWEFVYLNKKESPGLYRSRIAALKACNSEIILFLDDDVEVQAGYLKQLLKHYDNEHRISGVGGVDILCRRVHLWRRMYEYMILFRSSSIGQLSVSGYGGSMDRWSAQRVPFRTQYFSGCNMSFRQSALIGLQDLLFFDGHATGEDLYLSHRAALEGILVVDPSLRVRHYQVPRSRDGLEQVCYRQVINHYNLLLLKKASIWKRAAVLYTGFGLLVLSLGKLLRDLLNGKSAGSFPRVRGGVRGIIAVLLALILGSPAAKPGDYPGMR